MTPSNCREMACKGKPSPAPGITSLCVLYATLSLSYSTEIRTKNDSEVYVDGSNGGCGMDFEGLTAMTIRRLSGDQYPHTFSPCSTMDVGVLEKWARTAQGLGNDEWHET